MTTLEKRVIRKETTKTLTLQDILLIGILLAAGVVLKFFVGTVINFGMKPNFIIAMYCLTILLIRPTFMQSAIIGVLAGITCQFFPGQPYINILSELVGACVMVAVIQLPFADVLRRPIGTFIATLASGFSFIAIMYAIYYMGASITPTPLAIFMAIIFGTATINTIIVQTLYYPLQKALGRG